LYNHGCQYHDDAVEKPVDPEALDLGYLALFVGYAYGEAVQRELARAKLPPLRFSYGFVFQHLIGGERTIGELAERMQVTQQAASKSVAELERLGCVSRVVDREDARVRKVRLTEMGWKAIESARKARKEVEARVEKEVGGKEVGRARAVLVKALEALGGVEAVRRRKVGMPK
jgi:DNA-binding MarR family transcriptional regulator